MKDHPHDKKIDQGIRFLGKKDKKLATVIRRIGKLNYRSQQTGFAALVRIIVGQQLSGKAGETIFQQVRALTEKRRVTVDALKELDDTALRSAGLSAAKTGTVRDLIDKIDSGQFNIRSLPHKSEEEINSNITQVKGLGCWSAQMYLMFVLCRLDIFSADDLGIQNAICRLYDMDKKTDFEAFSERWRPYRTIACWYLWASLDNAPMKETVKTS